MFFSTTYYVIVWLIHQKQSRWLCDYFVSLKQKCMYQQHIVLKKNLCIWNKRMMILRSFFADFMCFLNNCSPIFERIQSLIFQMIKEINALYFRFSVKVHWAKVVCQILLKSVTKPIYSSLTLNGKHFFSKSADVKYNAYM